MVNRGERGTVARKKNRSAALCYLSPQGTTRKVGRKLASFLSGHGFETVELDLALREGADSIRSLAKQAGEASLLVVGTPVYADHALYPVVSFLEELPRAGGKPALAYVAFGGVSKGVALHQVADLLRSRGYSVKGVAKVLCVHSMMFRDEEPVGGSHPGEEDWDVLKDWIDAVVERLEPGNTGELDIDRFRSRNPATRLLTSTLFNMRFMGKVTPKIRFHRGRCTGCGACGERCPVGRLDNLPKIPWRPRCLHCYECVRVCPEGALDARISRSYPVIRFFRAISGCREKQITKYYL